MKAREPRRPVHIPARMRAGSIWSDAYIHNMSSRGLMVETAAAPPHRSYVEIRRGGQIAVCRVVWRKDGFVGVRAQDRLDIAAWVNEPRRTTKPAEAGAGEPSRERRVDPLRLASSKIGERHERSKRFAATFQFIVIVVAGACVAVILAIEVGAVLSRPIAALKANLPH